MANLNFSSICIFYCRGARPIPFLSDMIACVGLHWIKLRYSLYTGFSSLTSLLCSCFPDRSSIFLGAFQVHKMMSIIVVPAVPRFFKLGFALDHIYLAICGLLSWLRLHNVPSSDSQRLSQTTFPASSASARRIRETLSVLSFRDFAESSNETELDDSCAVCLGSFEEDDEIRKLRNCRHIFHRDCLDKWTDYHQETCPLCRCSLFPKSEGMVIDNE